MSAVIHQGVSVANVTQVELQNIYFSTNTMSHATKSIHISPRETANLKIETLVLNISQGRKIPYGSRSTLTVKCRETDLAFILQLYILMQQPIQAWCETADAKWFSYVANGVTQGAQAYGSASGTNLGVLSWDYQQKDADRYVEITFVSQCTVAETFKLFSSTAAALTGVATTMKSLGTQANATGGLASIQVPGWNTGAPCSIANTGGTAMEGVIVSGDLSIKSGSKMNINDNLPWNDRLIVNGKFIVGGVSANDYLAHHGTSQEACTFLAQAYAGDSTKLLNVASIIPLYNIGDDAMNIEVQLDGHVVCNPTDAAVAPLPNIDIGQNTPTILQLNLVNN